MLAGLTLDPVLADAAAAAMGCIFLSAAWVKLMDVKRFAAVLDNYALLPDDWLDPVAWLLPLLEMAAGLLLLFSASRAAGSALALVLLALVSAAVAVNVARGRTGFECGCGGDELPLAGSLLLRNAALAALLLMAAQRPAERAVVWVDVVTTVMLTLFLLGLFKVTNLLLGQREKLERLGKTP
ncbi:MAG: hypothetical protein LBV49_01185 [Azonexus sp.]|jgi:hypothetical protein|nr:hypothetical protein [Azonexus sp.]